MTDPESTLGRKINRSGCLNSYHLSKGKKNTPLISPIPLILNHWLNPWTLFFHHEIKSGQSTALLAQKRGLIVTVSDPSWLHIRILWSLKTQRNLDTLSPSTPTTSLEFFLDEVDLYFFKKIQMDFVEYHWFTESLLYTRNFARYLTCIIYFIGFMTEFREVQSQKLCSGQKRARVHHEEILKTYLSSMLTHSSCPFWFLISHLAFLPTGPSIWFLQIKLQVNPPLPKFRTTQTCAQNLTGHPLKRYLFFHS